MIGKSMKDKRNQLLKTSRKEEINRILNCTRYNIMLEEEKANADRLEEEYLEQLKITQKYNDKLDKMNKAINKLKQKFYSGEKPFQLEIEVICIRQIINEDENFPVIELLESGILNILTQFFNEYFLPYKTLLTETLWILLNLVTFPDGIEIFKTKNENNSLTEAILKCLHDKDLEVKKNA